MQNPKVSSDIKAKDPHVIPILFRLVGLLILAYLIYWTQENQIWPQLLERLESLGSPFKEIFFILAQAISTVLFFPSFVFTLAGGSLFGFLKGLFLSLIGAGLGAVSAFMIGRYLTRHIVEKAFRNNQTFHQLSDAIERKGWKIIFLARLTPIFPFLAGNYAFGLTRMPSWHYFLASVLGTIPSNSVYVFAGSMGADLLGNSWREKSPAEWGLLVLGFVATVLLTRVLNKMAKESLSSI